MASRYTFNGVSLDDPGGRWAVDREWYLPQGGPGADGTCQFSIEGKVRARPYYV